MGFLRRRARLLLAVLLGVGLLVAGAVVGLLGYHQTSGPDGAVRGYYRALADGDAPGALAWGNVPAGSRQLLTSTVLREQLRIARLQDLSVGAPAQRGDRATVPVTYRLAFASESVPVHDAVSVVRRNGDWRLARAAVATQLVVGEADRRARVLHHAVPDGTVLLFPGAAPISFDTDYLTLQPSSAVVTLGSTDDLAIVPEVVGAARTRVIAAVTSALRACVSASAAATCPLPGDRYVPDSLRGTLGKGALEVTVGADSDGSIVVHGQVPFSGSYRRLDFVNRAHTGTGRVQLDVDAELSAVPPLRVTWTSA